MAVDVGVAYVTLLPDARKLTPAIVKDAGLAGKAGGKQAAAGFGKTFGSGIKKVIGAGLALAGGQAVVGFFKDSITAASDLNESLNKSKVIFGDQAKAIEKWASGAAKNLALSKSEALEAASGFGNMFTQLGFSGDAAADMSKQVVKMSADLGSFNNMPTAQVADMISAAFRGEYDSLQQLMPTINAAAVEQQAMADTGKANAKELTQQEKAAATMALVVEGAAPAMNDLAETSGGAANAGKILGKRWEDMKATLGAALLPAVSLFLTALGGLLSFLPEVGSALVAVGGFISENSTAFLIAAAAVTAVFLPSLIKMGVVAVASAAKTVAAFVATRVAAVASAVVASAQILGLGVLWVRLAAISVAQAVRVAGAWVVTQLAALKAAVVSGAQFAVLVAKWIALGAVALAQAARVALAWLISMGPIAIVIAAVVGLVALIIKNWETIKTAIAAGWNFVKSVSATVWNAITSFLKTVWDGLVAAALFVWGLIKTYIITPIQAVWNFLVLTWNAIVTFINNTWTGLKNAANAAWSLIKDYIINPVVVVRDWLSNTFHTIYNTLAGVMTNLKNFFQGIWEGIKKIFKGAVNFVIRILNGVISGINTFIEGFNFFAKPFKVLFNLDFMIDKIDKIPQLAEGGIVKATPGGTLALLGEGGQDEAVIPLPKGGSDKIHNQVTEGLKNFLASRSSSAEDMAWALFNRERPKLGPALGAASQNIVAATGSLGGWVRQAMSITNVPPSWFQPLVGLAMHESGGNPNAINLWDINAQNGIPSQGLFQTIPSTFAAYGLGGSITDPVANAVAAIRYIISRYGSIQNIPSYRGGTTFVGGYRTGTESVRQTGMAFVHRGEGIVPAAQNHPGAGMPSTLVVVDVDGALIGRMRVAAADEVDHQLGGAASGLVYGMAAV